MPNIEWYSRLNSKINHRNIFSKGIYILQIAETKFPKILLKCLKMRKYGKHSLMGVISENWQHWQVSTIFKYQIRNNSDNKVPLNMGIRKLGPIYTISNRKFLSHFEVFLSNWKQFCWKVGYINGILRRMVICGLYVILDWYIPSTNVSLLQTKDSCHKNYYLPPRLL